jgi:hypothetical protein
MNIKTDGLVLVYKCPSCNNLLERPAEHLSQGDPYCPADLDGTGQICEDTMEYFGYFIKNNISSPNNLIHDHPIREWAEAIAGRVSDELYGLSKPDRRIFRETMVCFLGNSPDIVETLIGTGVIEEDYFETI